MSLAGDIIDDLEFEPRQRHGLYFALATFAAVGAFLIVALVPQVSTSQVGDEALIQASLSQ